MAVFQFAHEADAVGNHNQNHPHVFGEGEQQVPEVLASYRRCLVVERLHLYQSCDDTRHAVAEQSRSLFGVSPSVDDAWMEQYGEQSVAFQSSLFYGDGGSAERADDSVHAEDVALPLPFFCDIVKKSSEKGHVVRGDKIVCFPLKSV